MSKRLFFPLFILIILSSFPKSSIGQSYGKLVGNIIDSKNEEPLIGANIYIEDTFLGAATDLDGSFVILRIPPGKYKVVVEYLGYRKVTYSDVQILTDLTTKLNVALEQEVFEGEEIVVVAEKDVIRKDLTSAEVRVQAEDIAHMAVTDVGDLLSMQAGITKDADGGIHIRGGRTSEVSFMVNGISITDDFYRTQSLQIENESIQELQVISGTFNAEYGNAMSGIVNIVTKTGGQKFKANLDIWSGDYFSGRDDIFWNIDDINPFANYNFQGAVSGPIISEKLNFYVTARRVYDDGYLYAPLFFRPGKWQEFEGEVFGIPELGDSSAVPVNFKDSWSGQATLSWNIFSSLKLNLDFFGNTEKRKNYDHFYRWNPLGDRGDDEYGYTTIAKLTHSLSNTMFHELTMSYRYNELESKLYNSPTDPRYVRMYFSVGGNNFSIGGSDLDWFERNSRSRILKYDLTSQATKQHQFKGGIELKMDKVYYNNVTIDFEDENGVPKPIIRDKTTLSHTEITREPFKFAAYLQDKIEFESLIVNVGIRFDYFDPKGKIPTDFKDPNIYAPLKLVNKYNDLNGDGTIGLDELSEDNLTTISQRENYWWKDTKAKTQLSPRLGVAYPISEEGVIHFSYGIFQQIPQYSQLYIGDELKVSSGTGTYGPFGNPDLETQVTTMYELGLQQQFSQNISMDVTGYYRDIRNWVSTAPPIKTVLPSVTYVRYNNRDFANVRGITLAVHRSFDSGFAFNLDYSFSIAEGTNSDPDQEFNSLQGGSEPTKALAPLDWDQRHKVSGNLFIGGTSWGLDIVARFQTGQPYTPTSSTFTQSGQDIQASLVKNSRFKPDQLNMDINLYKNFEVSGFNLQ